MNKWKCTVCNYVVDSDEKPIKCVYCKADSHKIKALFKIIKKKHLFTD